MPTVQSNSTVDTRQAATPTVAATSTPKPQGLPRGMIIAHSTIADGSGNWQVIVCVANLGTTKASEVVADASWSAEFRLLALRSRFGPIDYKDRLARARLGELLPGTQSQVTLLLAAGDSANSVPDVQTQLSYRDGPPRAPDATVRCEPDGLRVAQGGADVVQSGSQLATPVIEAPKTGQLLPALITPLAPETPEAPVTAGIAAQITATSWLCLGLPGLLFVLVVAALVYKLRRRQRYAQGARVWPAQ